MKTFLSVLLSSLLLLSCGSSESSKVPKDVAELQAKEMQRITDSINSQAQLNKYNTADDEEVMVPKEIGFDLYKKRTIALDTPFVADSALVALFPGNYYFGEINLVVWTSSQTPSKIFPGWYGETEEPFPIKDGTETRLGSEVCFVDDNGRKNIFLAFSSFNFSGDLIRTGRFSCADFGLAHFIQENNKWVLKSFSPALGCYGAFGSLPSLSLLKFGKNNFGVCLENSNGGAGGPYYGDTYVFGLLSGEFKLLLQQNGTSRGNAPSDWSSEFSGTAGSKQFGDVRCVTKGDYQTYAHFKSFEDDTTNVPSAIKEIIKTKEHFYFNIVTDFEFRNGKYVFKNEDATITVMKPEDWAKEP